MKISNVIDARYMRDPDTGELEKGRNGYRAEILYGIDDTHYGYATFEVAGPGKENVMSVERYAHDPDFDRRMVTFETYAPYGVHSVELSDRELAEQRDAVREVSSHPIMVDFETYREMHKTTLQQAADRAPTEGGRAFYQEMIDKESTLEGARDSYEHYLSSAAGMRREKVDGMPLYLNNDRPPMEMDYRGEDGHIDWKSVDMMKARMQYLSTGDDIRAELADLSMDQLYENAVERGEFGPYHAEAAEDYFRGMRDVYTEEHDTAVGIAQEDLNKLELNGLSADTVRSSEQMTDDVLEQMSDEFRATDYTCGERIEAADALEGDRKEELYQQLLDLDLRIQEHPELGAWADAPEALAGSYSVLEDPDEGIDPTVAEDMRRKTLGSHFDAHEEGMANSSGPDGFRRDDPNTWDDDYRRYAEDKYFDDYDDAPSFDEDIANGTFYGPHTMEDGTVVYGDPNAEDVVHDLSAYAQQSGGWDKIPLSQGIAKLTEDRLNAIDQEHSLKNDDLMHDVRLLDRENFPVRTPYGELPAYITEQTAVDFREHPDRSVEQLSVEEASRYRMAVRGEYEAVVRADAEVYRNREALGVSDDPAHCLTEAYTKFESYIKDGTLEESEARSIREEILPAEYAGEREMALDERLGKDMDNEPDVRHSDFVLEEDTEVENVFKDSGFDYTRGVQQATPAEEAGREYGGLTEKDMAEIDEGRDIEGGDASYADDVRQATGGFDAEYARVRRQAESKAPDKGQSEIDKALNTARDVSDKATQQQADNKKPNSDDFGNK